jgi:hypothetical protein
MFDLGVGWKHLTAGQNQNNFNLQGHKPKTIKPGIKKMDPVVK